MKREDEMQQYDSVDSYMDSLSVKERISFLRACATHVRDACKESKLSYNEVGVKNE